ncbi:MAG: glycosyltransferase family 4 protein [Rhodospirillales bacterium]|nr:glycosyltransferase family 4 protein [Rhodospirillales bacterium]
MLKLAKSIAGAAAPAQPDAGAVLRPQRPATGGSRGPRPGGRSRPARIVAVNRFYAPDHSATAQLLSDLAESLAAGGQPVTIITSRLRYDEPAARLPARESVNGVAVRRVWTSRFGRASLPGRAVDYLTFYLSALLALLWEVRAGDTVLAKTDPPLISVPAALVSRLKGARFVNWCQDLYPETAAALGLGWAAGGIGRLLRRLRNWSLRQADLNIVLCGAMRARLLAEGVPAKRLRIIHNWADAAVVPSVRAADEPPTIVYSGNLGRAHGVDAIVELLQRTRDIPGLIYRFVGAGNGTLQLKRAVRERDLTNVVFEPYAPRAKLANSLARADLHLVSLAPDCEGLMLPSKLYGIMAAGRPTVFLGRPDSSIAELLASHGAGVTLDPARPESFAAALRAILGDAPRLAAMGANARRAFEAHYAAEHALAAWKAALTGEEGPAAPAAVAANLASK